MEGSRARDEGEGYVEASCHSYSRPRRNGGWGGFSSFGIAGMYLWVYDMLNINTDERHFVDSGYEKDIVRIGSVHGYRAIAGQAKSAVLCSSIVSTVSLSG